MTKLILAFILTGGSGFIAPLEVPAVSCGLAGVVAPGVQVDRLENPRSALWPDQADASKHCAVDIAARVRTLEPGEYHLAATVVTPVRAFGSPTPFVEYLAPDPHTSPAFMVSTAVDEEQTAVTSNAKFAWTQEAPIAVAQSYRYEWELDGAWQSLSLAHTCTVSPTNGNFSICTAPVPAITPGPHKVRVRAVDSATEEASDPSAEATFDMRVRPTAPKGVTIIQVKPGSGA